MSAHAGLLWVWNPVDRVHIDGIYTGLISEFVKRYCVTASIVELWATEEIGRNGRPIDDHGILWNIRTR
ncbi:MAG: hypothetical protein CM1200mP22_26160 [Dehalococcoidia bacterium]|nr:MAG: hypothetical protein CM1200mP22_26160 [Dehalococcoidia bacterium]